ncbi:hypothetical protein H0H81_008062 [Sphagnurus paluster]|uniref:SGT1-domain-containing protein n=1 Tax=Sphagnurus paluster TaxID=117069 RepID=A0A9P7KP12_9AGAR|nr:hypothetical protein H0H81_008062 [Sphagnurus paluster]
MEIFNRPPSIAEDTLQYTLYLPKNLSDKASAATFAACIRNYVDTLLPDFIWHRDAFELKLVSDPDPENNACILEGRMRVGDCVDDEWCTVWLLREISAKWDLAISVFDTDGEFLLIEAAEALPSWVKPTNSKNRVRPHILCSRLHLIPISHISPPSRKHHRRQIPGANEDEDRNFNNGDNDDEFISAQDAIALLRDPSIPTVAPLAVEETVWRRISRYPAATCYHVHKTKAFVPKDIAVSLVKNPSLVQRAVEAFYTRDAIQLRSAHRMNRFPPSSCVPTMVKMTRTAYAQLVGQKFFPPKVFGTWLEPEGTKEWRWRDVGMKIAVGFEMLYHESKSRSEFSSTTGGAMKSSSQAKRDALRRNPDYPKYIQNLVSADYFRGEIEGSERWNFLESKAADIFVEVRQEDNATRPSFAFQVQSAISDYSLNPVSVPGEEEDSDDWLNVDSHDFEAMLEQTMGNSKNTQTDAMDPNHPTSEVTVEDRLASEQAAKLKELAAKVENFVEGQGDLDGARFDDDTFSDEEFSDSESEMDSEDNEENSADSVTRQADMDKLVPGLEPSEYGKMPPSFHINSQRVGPTISEESMGESVDTETKTPSNEQPRSKPIRQPIIPRDKYDGVDSDDETDEEDVVEDAESEEDHPQVVGDIEIDMGEEEQEFLEFSRQALGISDDQWNDIVRDRKERGASASKSTPTKKTVTAAPTVATEKQTQGRAPAPGPRPNVNPNLDSFEAVMKAMDAELARIKPSSKQTKKTSVLRTENKGKGKATVEEEDEDIESAMDAELKAALIQEVDDDDEDNEEPPDYNLIKNFLESFKSQAGLSGPVSSLAGMLQPGWQLPRDES